MNSLTIKNIQDYLSSKYAGKASATGMFIKLVEEIGETAEALNQLEGRKSKSDSTSLEDELADIIHYTVAIANIYKIDLAEAIIRKDKTASIKYKQSPNLEEYINEKRSYL